MIPANIDRSQIPHKPGVYQFQDRSGKIIYVGKAIDLYSRVSSYFNNKDLSVKTRALVENIASVETIIVESEIEALILEANLIKQYLPQYNIRLTDDKDYLYIKVTKEDFPRVVTARRHDLKDALRYFGPFPSSTTVKQTLKRLRRVFPWCQFGGQRLGIRGLKRACFYYHLGLCPGACVGEISKEDYRKIVDRFSSFLAEGKQKVLDELMSEMNAAAGDQRFEEALRIKKTIEGVIYLTQPNQIKSYLENPNFLEDQRQIALEELQRALKLEKIPERIECYDISNIQGHESTGSMVVLTNGEIDKSQYRRFKIKITGKPDDYAMHQEMMRRRLKHAEWPLPDLFIIDGGLGQVRASSEELSRHRRTSPKAGVKSLEIPIFGLAKRFEWLYSPDGEVIKLSKSSGALKLVTKIRDEAHRFAITYHRKLHRKAVIGDKN